MPPSRSTPSTGRPARNNADALRAHYLAADYVVGGEDGFVLKVGCASAALRALHRAHGVSGSVFLTACNPGSRRRSAWQNDLAQRRLVSRIRLRGYVGLLGLGIDPAGAWPPEESVLVLGMPAAEALALARRFGQNALLVMAANAVPRLVWAGPAEPAAA